MKNLVICLLCLCVFLTGCGKHDDNITNNSEGNIVIEKSKNEEVVSYVKPVDNSGDFTSSKLDLLEEGDIYSVKCADDKEYFEFAVPEGFIAKASKHYGISCLTHKDSNSSFIISYKSDSDLDNSVSDITKYAYLMYKDGSLEEKIGYGGRFGNTIILRSDRSFDTKYGKAYLFSMNTEYLAEISDAMREIECGYIYILPTDTGYISFDLKNWDIHNMDMDSDEVLKKVFNII